MQDKVLNRLRSLRELPGVSITVSPSKKTIKIRHSAYHSLSFNFKWVDGNHFVGYFLDASDNQSQAVVSLWSGLDAINFSAAYALLTNMRARQEKAR